MPNRWNCARRASRFPDRNSGEACLYCPRCRIQLVIVPALTPILFAKSRNVGSAAAFVFPRDERCVPFQDELDLVVGDLTRSTDCAWHRRFLASLARDRSPLPRTARTRRAPARPRATRTPPRCFQQSRAVVPRRGALPQFRERGPIPAPGTRHPMSHFGEAKGDLARISSASACVTRSTSRLFRSTELASRFFPAARSFAACSVSARHFSSASRTRRRTC
jgi:hypothetical protein